MATDLSTVSGLVKRVYDDYVERQQNLKTKFADEIAKSTSKYNPGAGYYGAINDYGNESGGAITENETFRTIDNENYAQWNLSPKVIVWPIEFSGLSAVALESNEEAFASNVIDALDVAKNRMKSDENRQYFGLGTGLLASPSAAVASNLTSFTVDSTQYLRDNMVIDVCTGSTQTAAAKRISSVDRINSVIYLSTSLGAAITTTDAIVKQNIRASAPADGKEMMGLRGIVDDGTELSTFQGITVSGTRVWRGRRLDASSASLTSDFMQRLIDDVELLSGEMPDTLIMHNKQRRRYLDIVVPQKRFQDDNLDTGFSKLSFNGMDLFLDKDCQVDRVYAVAKDKLRMFELQAIGMGKQDGSDTFLRKVNADVFQAYWRHYSNFGTSQRNRHGALVNLSVPTGVA